MVEYRSVLEFVTVLGLIILGGIQVDNINKDTAFYCESSKIIMPSCDSVASYYGLNNGKCVNSVIGNKLCRTGWVKLNNYISNYTSEPVLINSLIEVKNGKWVTKVDDICYLYGDLSKQVNCE